jgi:hypothetical protein
MRIMKKISLALIMLIMLSTLTGGGETNVTSAEKKDFEATEEIVSEKEEEEKQKNDSEKVYGIGERLIIDDKYALEIIGVTETEERNEFSDKEVAQVLIIDYLYENIGEETEDIYISDMNFKFVDDGGNMCTTYPVDGNYGPEYTPLGARTLSSMVIGTMDESKKIKINYYDNAFNSKPDGQFEIAIGYSVEPKLEGEMPEYEDMFELKDIIEIKTEEGDYTLSIDSVELVKERNQYSRKNPKNVYKIKYTYSNISKDDELYISDMDFRVIDENGNMAYNYPGNIVNYPQAVIKGAKCNAEMIFGTHTEGNALILCYTQYVF